MTHRENKILKNAWQKLLNASLILDTLDTEKQEALNEAFNNVQSAMDAIGDVVD